jgi:hypothetical protein
MVMQWVEPYAAPIRKNRIGNALPDASAAIIQRVNILS